MTLAELKKDGLSMRSATAFGPAAAQLLSDGIDKKIKEIIGRGGKGLEFFLPSDCELYTYGEKTFYKDAYGYAVFYKTI